MCSNIVRLGVVVAMLASCSGAWAAEPAAAAATSPAGLNLAEVRREVLAYCESIRDTVGPYGCYRAGPGKPPDSYAACDVAILRTIMGEDLTKTLSEAERRQWIDHINSFQQPEDGHYEARLGHSPLHGNGMTIGALGVLGGRQKFPVKLYEPFDTPDKVAQWLDTTVDWRAQWSGSHLFWGGMHCFSLSRACTPAWRERAFAWLDANLDPATGWWRKGVPHKDRHQPLGGSVHILPIYQHHARPFPLPERVIDSVLALQLPSGRWLQTKDKAKDANVMDYLELDALYALRYMQSLRPAYRADDVRAAVDKYAALVCREWPKFKGTLFAGHPHRVLAAVSTFGLLQQFFPERFPDEAKWTDIFSDIRFYRTDAVENLPAAPAAATP